MMKKYSFLCQLFKLRSRRILLSLVKVNCLLFAVMLVFLPVRQASAYIIDLHQVDLMGIGSLVEADSVIGTAGSLKATDIRPFLELDDLGDLTRGHLSINNPFPGEFLSSFAVHITGIISISTEDDWTFLLNHDDGARLMIDGVTTILADGIMDNRDSLGTVNLAAGLHNVDIVFFENFGGASLEFFAAQGSHTVFNDNFELLEGAPVPEPATMLLLGSGLFGLAVLGRRKFNKR